MEGETNVVSAAIEADRRLLAAVLTFFVERAAAFTKFLGGDATLAFVAVAILRANVEHLEQAADLGREWSDALAPPPDSERIPVSAYAVSKYLGLPSDTVRRKIAILRGRGQVLALPTGFIAPARVLMTPEALALQADCHLSNRKLFLALSEAGLVTEQLMADAHRGPAGVRMGARAVNAYAPELFSAVQQVSGLGCVPALLLAAVAANTLSGRSGERLTALALADRCGLARETTRRHVARLVDMGLVEWRGHSLAGPYGVHRERLHRVVCVRGARDIARVAEQLGRSGVLADL